MQTFNSKPVRWVSPSRLSKRRKCRRYGQTKQGGPKTEEQVLGDIRHACIERYLEKREGGMSLARACIEAAGDPEFAHVDPTVRAVAIQQVRLLPPWMFPPSHQILSIEGSDLPARFTYRDERYPRPMLAFNLTESIAIRMRMDLVHMADAETLVITDWKGWQLVDYSVEALCYAIGGFLLAREWGLLAIKRVLFWPVGVPAGSLKADPYEFLLEDFDAMLSKLVAMAEEWLADDGDEVRLDQLPITPGRHCRNCPLFLSTECDAKTQALTEPEAYELVKAPDAYLPALTGEELGFLDFAAGEQSKQCEFIRLQVRKEIRRRLEVPDPVEYDGKEAYLNEEKVQNSTVYDVAETVAMLRWLGCSEQEVRSCFLIDHSRVEEIVKEKKRAIGGTGSRGRKKEIDQRVSECRVFRTGMRVKWRNAKTKSAPPEELEDQEEVSQE